MSSNPMIYPQVPAAIQEISTLATGAEFSECRRYRYRLWRIWNDKLPRAVFVMLNPSTADEIANDPTIERCYRRTLAWAAQGSHLVGGIEVVNAFAWRETDSKLLPKLVAAGTDIVGADNDRAILAATGQNALIICAWGKSGTLGGRDAEVKQLLRGAGRKLYTLAHNSDRSPAHPLYLAYTIQPQEWVD